MSKQKNKIPSFDLINTPLEKVNMIEASAGTGKTYNIQGIFLRLILESGISFEQILVVTFTEAATQELKDRIRDIISKAYGRFSGKLNKTDALLIEYLYSKFEKEKENKEKILKNALRMFDEASIYTIHGFCRKVLTENSFESNTAFSPDIQKTGDNILKTIIDDYWRLNFIEKSREYISFMKIAGFKKEDVFSGIKNNVGKSLMALSEETEEEITFEMLLKDFKHLQENFNDLKNIWISDSNEVLNCINKSGLNGQSYKKPTTVKNARILSDFFDKNFIYSILDYDEKAFEYFSFEKLVSKLKKGENLIEHTFFNEMDNFIQDHDLLKSKINKHFLFVKHQILEYAKEKIENEKNRRNIITFDDLINYTDNALKKKNNFLKNVVRRKYKAALIDEFQDTDTKQFDIFSSLFFEDKENTISFMIGDPKQSIYKFRGADINSYRNARNMADNIYTLDTNYRSSKTLINAVNNVFNNHSNPFYTENNWLSFEDVNFPEEKEEKNKMESFFQVKYIESDILDSKGNAKYLSGGNFEESVFIDVVNSILKNVKDEDIKPQDIAVLVRSKNQADTLKSRLIKHNIPCVVKSNKNVFESEVAKSLYDFLKAIIFPDNTSLIAKMLSGVFFNYSFEIIENILKDEEKFSEINDKLLGIHKKWIEKGFSYCINGALESFNIRENLLKTDNAERNITNLNHILEILFSEFLGVKGLNIVLKFLEYFFEDVEDEENEAELRLESDGNSVNIVTIHASKGLQYPVVYVPFMHKSVIKSQSKPDFLSYNLNGKQVLSFDRNNQEAIEKSIEESLAEELRLLYVAITRAETRCILYWGDVKAGGSNAGATRTPLYYIFHCEEMSDGMKDIKSMRKDLEDLQGRSKGSIKLSFLGDLSETEEVYSEDHEDVDLKVRSLRDGFSVDNLLRISSFSAMSSGASHSHDISEKVDDFNSSLSIVHCQLESVLNMPGGIKTGHTFHEILERVNFEDFSSNLDVAVKEVMDKYGVDRVKWEGIVKENIQNILNCNIDVVSDGFKLSDLRECDKLSELEFIFPVNRVENSFLRCAMEGAGLDKGCKDFYLASEKFNFDVFKGYISGFIDLTFRYDNKFYILDWKTNFLGDSIGCYGSENLRDAIVSSHYYLQYYLYSVALNRFLKNRLGECYSYDENFGGVLYVFTRGIDSTGKYGIFYDKPDKVLIESIENEFKN